MTRRGGGGGAGGGGGVHCGATTSRQRQSVSKTENSHYGGNSSLSPYSAQCIHELLIDGLRGGWSGRPTAALYRARPARPRDTSYQPTDRPRALATDRLPPLIEPWIHDRTIIPSGVVRRSALSLLRTLKR